MKEATLQKTLYRRRVELKSLYFDLLCGPWDHRKVQQESRCPFQASSACSVCLPIKFPVGVPWMIVCTSLLSFQSPALVRFAFFRHINKQTNNSQKKRTESLECVCAHACWINERPLCLCAWTKITKRDRGDSIYEPIDDLKTVHVPSAFLPGRVRRGEVDSLCPNRPLRRQFVRSCTARSWFVFPSTIKIPFRLLCPCV